MYKVVIAGDPSIDNHAIVRKFLKTVPGKWDEILTTDREGADEVIRQVCEQMGKNVTVYSGDRDHRIKLMTHQAYTGGVILADDSETKELYHQLLLSSDIHPSLFLEGVDW